MNKTKATEGRESDSSFRLHPSAFKKVAGARKASLVPPYVCRDIAAGGTCEISFILEA
jgi:hypothetical protein